MFHSTSSWAGLAISRVSYRWAGGAAVPDGGADFAPIFGALNTADS